VSTVEPEISTVDRVPPDTPVWVCVRRYNDQELPGRVLEVSDLAALVRYELPGGGAMVDTVLWWRVQRRGPDRDAVLVTAELDKLERGSESSGHEVVERQADG
jgi:hypothetical protein